MHLCPRCPYRITMQLQVERDKPCAIFQTSRKKNTTRRSARGFTKQASVLLVKVCCSKTKAHMWAQETAWTSVCICDYTMQYRRNVTMGQLKQPQAAGQHVDNRRANISV